MYKILKNAIPYEKMLECQRYIEKNSENYNFEDGSDDKGKYQIKRIFNNQLLSSCEVKDLFFYEPLIQKIKKEIGPFTIINYFSGMINSFGTKVHRDGQSFGFNFSSKSKSKKIFKIMFYFDLMNGASLKCLDVNMLDFELKNIFLSKKIFMKINYYYENFLRKKLMKTLKLNLGDVIIMDNNTWHSASFEKKRVGFLNSNFKCKKILLSFEVINDHSLVNEHKKHVKNHYAIKSNGEYVETNPHLIDRKYLDILNNNNINLSNL